MTLVLWTVAAIWGFSSVVAITIFAIDERAHRRRVGSEFEHDSKIVPPSVRAERVLA